MDTNRTEDLRVLRTHTLLLRALSDLLQEMSFDEIRVKDLCQRAMVHRSTFYAHFEDKVHLLTFGILELMEVFIPLSPTTTLDDYQRSMCRVFKHFQRNRQMYTLLFLDLRNTSTKVLFRQKYTQAYENLMLQHFPSIPREDLILYSRHFIGGLLSVVDWWLETGTKISADQLAARFVRLIPNHIDIFPRDGTTRSPTELP